MIDLYGGLPWNLRKFFGEKAFGETLNGKMLNVLDKTPKKNKASGANFSGLLLIEKLAKGTDKGLFEQVVALTHSTIKSLCAELCAKCKLSVDAAQISPEEVKQLFLSLIKIAQKRVAENEKKSGQNEYYARQRRAVLESKSYKLASVFTRFALERLVETRLKAILISEQILRERRLIAAHLKRAKRAALMLAISGEKQIHKKREFSIDKGFEKDLKSLFNACADSFEELDKILFSAQKYGKNRGRYGRPVIWQITRDFVCDFEKIKDKAAEIATELYEARTNESLLYSRFIRLWMSGLWRNLP